MLRKTFLPVLIYEAIASIIASIIATML